MKITDMVISAVLKKGILYEARNCDLEFEIPMNRDVVEGVTSRDIVKVTFKAEHMTLKIEKE